MMLLANPKGDDGSMCSHHKTLLREVCCMLKRRPIHFLKEQLLYFAPLGCAVKVPVAYRKF